MSRDMVSTKDYTVEYVAKHFLKWREKQKSADVVRERVAAEKAAQRDAIANGDIDAAELEILKSLEDF